MSINKSWNAMWVLDVVGCVWVVVGPDSKCCENYEMELITFVLQHILTYWPTGSFTHVTFGVKLSVIESLTNVSELIHLEIATHNTSVCQSYPQRVGL